MKGEELRTTINLWVLLLSIPSILVLSFLVWSSKKVILYLRTGGVTVVERVVEKEGEPITYEHNGNNALIFRQTNKGAEYSHTFTRIESGLLFAGYANLNTSYFENTSDIVDSMGRPQGRSESMETRVECFIKIENYDINKLPTDKQILVRCGAMSLNTLQSWVKNFK